MSSCNTYAAYYMHVYRAILTSHAVLVSQVRCD